MTEDFIAFKNMTIEDLLESLASSPEQKEAFIKRGKELYKLINTPLTLQMEIEKRD